MVLKILDEKGGFLIEGAINQINAEIGVFRYAVYNYLNGLKTKKKREII